MKMLILILALLASAAMAQNFTMDSAGQLVKQTFRPKTLREVMLGKHIFKRVDGKIYNFLLNGKYVDGDIDRFETNGILVLRHGDAFIAIKNSEADPNLTGQFSIDGKPVNHTGFIAIKVGEYMSGDVALDLYDCGKMLPEDEEKVQMEAWEKVQMQADQSRAWTEAEAMKPFTNLESLAWVSTNAASGDAFAQFCLGEHYMRGDGSRTNIILAIRWLTIAAAHGSLEASNQLVELSNPK